MKAALEQRNYLAVVLLCMAVALLGLLYWEWDQGSRLEQQLVKMRKTPVTPVSMKAILPEFQLPEADSGFPELISRSLFSTSRRSSATSTKGGRSAMKKGQFVLVGVLVTPAQKSALLRDVQTNKTETVAQNAVVRGLTLGEVEPTRVVLRQGAETEELILNVQIGSKGTAAPPPGASAAAPKPPAQSASTPPLPAPGASAPPGPSGVAPKPEEAASAPKRAPPGHGDPGRKP